MSWLTALGTHLQNNTIGTLGTSLWMAQYPLPKSEGVLIVPTGGLESDKALGVMKPSVQVMARYASFATAWSKAHDVYNLLNEMLPVTVSGTKLFYAKAVQPPFSIGQKDALWRVVCNYRFHVHT